MTCVAFYVPASAIKGIVLAAGLERRVLGSPHWATPAQAHLMPSEGLAGQLTGAFLPIFPSSPLQATAMALLGGSNLGLK